MKKRICAALSFMALIIILLCSIVHAKSTVMKIGDYIQMGTYYEEPIIWRCVAFERIAGYDENGNPIIDSTDTVAEYEDGYLPLMLSDKVICQKAFDAKGESASHGEDVGRIAWGSNYWSDSNIRLWLNSAAARGGVDWLCGNPPSEEYVDGGRDEYADEAGFLTNFSYNDLNAVKEVTQKSIAAMPEYENGIYTSGSEPHKEYTTIAGVVENYDKAYSEQVTDKMFLLDVKQINTVYKNRSVLGDDYYIGEPTAQASANSEKAIAIFEAGRKCWSLLRSPYADRSFSSRAVDPYGNVIGCVAYDACGVRPAFFLNEYTAFSDGDGSEEVPYANPGITHPDFSLTIAEGGATVQNITDTKNRAAFVFVNYTEGKVTDVSTRTLTFNPREKKKLNFDNSGNFKIFVWNSRKGIMQINDF